MRDANRLRRLVWNGPAPARVASRPRTRAASGLRPAANRSRLPGAWPPGPERSPTFARNGEAGGEYDRLRKARPDAEGERRNGAPEGATSSQEGVQIRISRAPWRAVPSLRNEERKRNTP